MDERFERGPDSYGKPKFENVDNVAFMVGSAASGNNQAYNNRSKPLNSKRAYAYIKVDMSARDFL
ncbi:MAG: hypothetical protein QXS32_08250 [Candidatus Nezhaarchaeales archaeon]